MRTSWRSASCGASWPPSSSCALSRALLAAVLSPGTCRSASCAQSFQHQAGSAHQAPFLPGLLFCSGCSATAAAAMLRCEPGLPHTDLATLQCSTGAYSAPQPEAAALQSRVNAMTAERELLTAQLAQVCANRLSLHAHDTLGIPCANMKSSRLMLHDCVSAASR